LIFKSDRGQIELEDNLLRGWKNYGGNIELGGNS
jgi:hypothetical protein